MGIATDLSSNCVTISVFDYVSLLCVFPVVITVLSHLLMK